MPDIDWSSLSGVTKISNSFCDLIFDLNLSQLVESSTHHKGNILDLLLTNSEDRIKDVSILPQEFLPFSSDHYMVTFSLSIIYALHIPKLHPNYVLNYSKTDFEGLCSYLLDIDFSSCLQSDDVEFIWSCIKGSLLNGILLFTPKVKIHAHLRPKWVNSDLQHLTNCLRSLKRKYRLKPTKHILGKIHYYEQSLLTKLVKAKSDYESNLIHKFATSNNSHLYRYIQNLTRNSSLPPSMSFKSTTVTSDKDKASLFNNYFFSVFTTSSLILPDIDSLKIPVPSLAEINIHDYEVFDTLYSLDTTKSQGIDGIGPKVFKNCAPAIYIPLHHLFILSLPDMFSPKTGSLTQ